MELVDYGDARMWDMERAIEIFPWNENFATGIDEIDVQHKRLIELLNVLVGHLAFRRGAPSIDQIITELKDYAAIHFETEEKIWGQYFNGDPWEVWHKTAHVDFVQQIIDLSTETDGRSYDEAVEHVVSFLTHWLALHIIESDKRMAKVVLAMPSGISLERAKELSNKEMSGSTRVLIDTVMSMYDNLAHRTIQLTREISSRIQHEQMLQAAQDELRRLKDEAEQSEMRTVNEIKNFAYILSHHLQEPVRQQLLHTSILKKIVSDQGTSTPELETAMAHVSQGGERLRMLLGDMQLHLSLTHSPWTPKPCKTQDTLDRAMQRLATKIRETGAVIQHGDMPRAAVDRGRLTDVLTALIDNSLCFRRDGVAPIIQVDVQVRADDLLWSVQDNGIGIADTMRERVFGIFERLAPHKGPSGTGIGLALVRKIVESAGGTVWIETADGGGTRVCFTIPV